MRTILAGVLCQQYNKCWLKAFNLHVHFFPCRPRKTMFSLANCVCACVCVYREQAPPFIPSIVCDHISFSFTQLYANNRRRLYSSFDIHNHLTHHNSSIACVQKSLSGMCLLVGVRFVNKPHTATTINCGLHQERRLHS